MISAIAVFLLFSTSSNAGELLNLPKFQYNNSPTPYVSHSAYSVSYNQEYKQPNWVQYDLTCADLDSPVERTNDFREDLKIAGGTLKSYDYKYSGYDRGHLAPARDMARSEKIMSESFLMSNMSPQDAHFNRYGLWRKSENQVRFWACDNNKITVVAGAILNGEGTKVNKLFVPKYFYKIVLTSDYNAIGFIFENTRDRSPISSYVVSVDEIEEITGLDFFSNLPDQLEDEVESSVNLALWTFSSN